MWVRFGAAANVDVTLSGMKTVPLPAGTGDVLATAKGIRPVA